MHQKKILEEIKNKIKNEEEMIFPFFNIYIELIEKKHLSINQSKYIKDNKYLVILLTNEDLRIKNHEIDCYIDYKDLTKESLEKLLKIINIKNNNY